MLFGWSCYGLFLNSINPTKAIAMIMAIVDTAMYVIRSVVVAVIGWAVAVGVVVGVE